MGLKSYFKASKADAAQNNAAVNLTRKQSTVRFNDQIYESSQTRTRHNLNLPRSGSPLADSDSSRPASRLSTNDNEEVKSIRSTRSRYLVDIRHEVMINHLFQQQCGAMWINHNSSAQCEGIMLRKTRGEYLACPPQIMASPFAVGCKELNLHVSIHTRRACVRLTYAGGYDRQLETSHNTRSILTGSDRHTSSERASSTDIAKLEQLAPSSEAPVCSFLCGRGAAGSVG